MGKWSSAQPTLCPLASVSFQVILKKAAEGLSFPYPLHIIVGSSQGFINHLSLLYHLLNWVRTARACCVRHLLLVEGKGSQKLS